MALPGGQRTVGPHFVPEGECAGLLFDCDGTLIDTMPLFYYSWEETCPKFGLKMTVDDFYGFAGMPLPDIVRSLFRKQKGAEPSEEMVAEFLAQKKAAHAVVEERKGHPAPIDCVTRLAFEAVERGVPVCIATSGLRSHVEEHIRHAGLAALFNDEKQNIVCAADVAAGKPAPDIFIEAARRLGVAPSQCRAYEDGESGLQSAHAAGCHVIDVTYMDQYPAEAALRNAKATAEAERRWIS